MAGAMTESTGHGQAQFWRGGLRWMAVAGLLALAGCKMIPDAGKNLPPPPPAQTDADVIAPLPTDTERHRVALLLPMSGTNANVGRSIADATTMALLDTRTEKLRITTYDTAAAGGAAAAARKAVAEGAKLILGPLTADDVRLVSPVARGASVPVISYSNDVGVAGNGAFIMGFVPTQSVERVVRYARSNGATSFAALVPKGLYGERAGDAFLRAVRDSGGTVVALESFDRSAGSVTAAVKRLAQSSSYDALMIADTGRIALQAAPLVRANGGAEARLLGTELWNTETTLAASSAMRGAWFASVSDSLYNQFATKYRARYSRAPYRLATLGYDSVLLAARIAQDWPMGRPFPTSRLTDSDGFMGLDGTFRFTNAGIAERALEVQQIGAGTINVVDPAPRSLGR